MSSELEGALWSILDLLRPYSDELVLIGGWVPYLQLNYGRAARAGTRTSRTGEAAPAPARIPLLGAYVLNKANTFNLRGGADAREKAGKDLLYLRDIMAAGEEAEAVMNEDLNAMRESDHTEQVDRDLRRALTHLEMVAPKYQAEAARILAARESLDHAAATADVEGHLFDLNDTLRGAYSAG